MQDRDYSVGSDFLKRLFGETLHNVELRACANARGGSAFSIFTRDTADIETFCRKRDVDGYGTYFGMCTRGIGEQDGSAANVRECPALWVDIDCAKQGIAGDEARSALAYLPHPPSIIVNSGGGLHAYWVLEEAADVSPDSPAREQVQQCLRALVHVLAGDPAVAEAARIMRLPGTLNSKPATVLLNGGSAALCEIEVDAGHVHDLDTLSEWLDEQRAVLRGATSAPKPVNEQDPFVAYAREAGYEPAIDIEAELAAMSHGAEGPSSIHSTQIRVTYSMIARGYEDEEIVDRILRATEAAAPGDQKWNWKAEEREIRRDLKKARVKQAASPRHDAKPRSNVHPLPALMPEQEADAEAVQPKSKTKAKEGKSTTVAVGRAAMGVWHDRYGPVMHTGGTTYAYEGGVWVEWCERLAQRLRAIVQEACASLRVEPKTALLGAARAYFMDRPELVRDDVRFDEHGLLVAEDACLDLASYAVIAHSPDHYATRKSAATLAGSRECSSLLGFMREAFSDNAEGVAIVATLQEFFGASVMPLPAKQRGHKKGMFAHGPSRCSKTQVSELLRYLLGHTHTCGAPMRGLEDRFSTEPLIGKYGWIADDAVGEGEFLNADIYKVVVTGEQTSTKTKGGKNWEGRFGIPVLLTANNLPRVKDQSDAVYNRSLILPMTNVRPEGAPEPEGYSSIAEKIGREELTGLLWWAIEGWQRLAERGTYDPPAVMLEANKALKDSNNPVGAWRRECLEFVPDCKVLRADLLGSMNGWLAQEFGADERPWSGRRFFPKLTDLIPGYKKETHESADADGNRLLVGVQLTQAGLLAWRTFKDSRYGSDTSHMSSGEDFVNRDHGIARVSGAPLESRRPRF